MRHALPLCSWSMALLLAGCATVPPPLAATPPPLAAPGPLAPPAAASAAAFGAGVGSAAPSVNALAPARSVPPAAAAGAVAAPPFALVIKDATRVDGPITAWHKDDKLWLELAPEDFGKPFLLSPKLASGIGEAFILGGLMAYGVSGAGGPQLVEFVRVHNQVRLLSRNTEVIATPGTPEARAVAASYSPSLLGSMALASQPHPQRGSVLVDASALFLSDLQGVAMQLQRAFRQGYSLDPRHSSLVAVRGSARALEIRTQNHYLSASIAAPQPGSPAGAPVPTVPRYVPDTRSLFVGQHYSLAALPATPMASRRADARLGLTTQSVLDYSDDLARSPRVRWVERWRLEKKQPDAALSEPVEPITYWIDRNVPLKYRAVVADAILEWNKAFERIGFKDAIVVKQQADDAAFDTLDFGVASVRWLASAVPAFGAIAPKHVDPRSGEILDADIGFESLSSRSQRNLRAQTLSGADAFSAVLGAPAARVVAGPSQDDSSPSGGGPGAARPWGRSVAADDAQGARARHCQYGDMAAEQLAYALDVMAARGELEPGSAQAEEFVRAYIKDTLMHEVGHTLGLRHNFRASRVYTEQQLADADFTREHGTTGSVMEYNAINLPQPGQRGGVPFMTTLGPYDYWVIEYAYKPIAPEHESAELRRIAARSDEPLLAYGTDEDAAYGIDPETIQLDLGADPIAYAAKRLAIARELFARQEKRKLDPDQSYAVLRRSLSYAISDAGRAVGVLVRQIGGVRTLRDHPGSGRDPLLPTDAATQRRALELIAHQVLAIDGLALTPTLQRRLAPDFDDRADNPALATDFSVPQRLLDLQRVVLAQLMSDAVAARILDSVGKADSPQRAFQLAELYQGLQRAVWSELAHGGHISATRRELQREHVNRVAAALLRPGGHARADARSLLRLQALQLQAQLNQALKRSAALDAASRAHLLDSADTLAQALTAKVQRTGV